MSNWKLTNFTAEEIDLLEQKGWDVSKNNLSMSRDGGWKRIVKRQHDLYEVRSFMDDPENNSGWWAFDGEYPTLEKALEHT
jgi:hypothetical protein